MSLDRVEDATQLTRLTELEHDERTRLAAANNQFQAIYDQGLFAGRLDLDGTVIDANRSSLAMCGYVRGDVIGKPFWECGWWNRAAEVQRWVKAGVEQANSWPALPRRIRVFRARAAARTGQRRGIVGHIPRRTVTRGGTRFIRARPPTESPCISATSPSFTTPTRSASG